MAATTLPAIGPSVRSAGAVRRGRRTIARLVVVMLLIAALISGAVIAASPERAAAAGNPGVPQDPMPIFQEDFELSPRFNPIRRVTSYVGAAGQTYTAHPSWLRDCNGWVASFNQAVAPITQVNDCDRGGGTSGAIGWNRVQQLAEVLGRLRGDAAPSDNFAISAYTQADPGSNRVEFQTAANLNLPAAVGRYVVMSADVAAINMNINPPQLQMRLLGPTGAVISIGTPAALSAMGTNFTTVPVGIVNSVPAIAGTMISPRGYLVSDPSLGINIINQTSSGAGNDHAFDNITLLDATPSLDKEFIPASVYVGQTSTLTFTITNTAELSAKPGWSFTDNLPTGLTVAGAASTTCQSGVVTAAAGATSISVTGNLAQNVASCTVSIPVTAGVGSYTNGPGNVVPSGLNPPGTTTLEVMPIEPAISIVKTASLSSFTAPDQAIGYSFVVSNTGNMPLTGVGVTDVLTAPAGPALVVSCPQTTLAVAAEMTCTAPYTTTQADVDNGGVHNSAIAHGADQFNTNVTSAPSEVTVPAVGAPAIEIVKTASVTAFTQVGQAIVYSFEVTNTGNVTLTDVGVDDVLTAPAGPALVVTCPNTTLEPNDQMTCTAPYVITAADVQYGSVHNSATAQGTPPSGVAVESAPSEVTILATTFAVQIQKLGEDSAAELVLMDGSQWAIYTASTGGTAVVDPVPAASNGGSPVVGTFHATGLAAGTYWLEETQALGGFQLLAERVEFTVSSTGAITLGAGASSNVVVDDVAGVSTIRVVDVPALDLPDTGGMGTVPIYIAGGILILIAISALLFTSVRRRHAPRRVRSSRRLTDQHRL